VGLARWSLEPDRLHRLERAVALVLALAGIVGGPAFADSAVPADVQAAIITRLLGYDRALKARGSALVIGIVAKSSDKASTQAQAEMEKAFTSLKPSNVQGMNLIVVTHAYKDPADLLGWIVVDNVQVLYVAPGLTKEVGAIRDVCSQKKVASVSPARDLVEKGLAIGVVLKGENPSILINLPVAESIGMDLDPKVLKLSEIVR
jgi:hypothetical protein